MEQNSLMQAKQKMFPRVYSTSDYKSYERENLSSSLDNRFRKKYDNPHKRVKVTKFKGYHYTPSVKFTEVQAKKTKRAEKLKQKQFSVGQHFIPWNKVESFLGNLYSKISK